MTDYMLFMRRDTHLPFEEEVEEEVLGVEDSALISDDDRADSNLLLDEIMNHSLEGELLSVRMLRNSSGARSKRSSLVDLAAHGPVCVKEGMLIKRARGNRHLWQNRFFRLVLDQGVHNLVYYKSQEAFDSGKAASGTIRCTDIKGVRVLNKGVGSHDGTRFCLEVHQTGKLSQYQLRSTSASQCFKWTQLLAHASGQATVEEGVISPVMSPRSLGSNLRNSHTPVGSPRQESVFSSLESTPAATPRMSPAMPFT